MVGADRPKDQFTQDSSGGAVKDDDVIGFGLDHGGIALDGLEATIHGDLDLHGFLGLDSNVRPGYEQIRVTIKATGDFDDNQLAELASLTRYSPVRDIVSRPVPVAIDLARA